MITKILITLFLICGTIISCDGQKKVVEKNFKANKEYANKLNATKKKYPFERWRESFKNGLEQYTTENCNKAEHIFDALIEKLIKIGEKAKEEEKKEIFKQAILELNKLNEGSEGSLIETGEREELCELVNEITRACNLNPQKYGQGEGLASEWRDW